MTNSRRRFSTVLGLLIIILGLFWNDIRERIPDVVPISPKVDIVAPDQDAISKVSHIATNVTNVRDRLNLCVFNKVFASRLLDYPTDAQQINDVYTLAAKNVFGSSLKGKYPSLGEDLTNLMKSVVGDENHVLSAEEKETLNRYFMALAWCLDN